MVRRDLPLGAVVAQTIHAAGESSPGPSLPPDTHAIALSVPDELTLLRLEEQLVAAGVPFKAIREPDAPYFGQLMAIGVVPTAEPHVRKLLRRLPLIEGEIQWTE